MKIKICGLRTPGDASAVNEAMPDYVGFILTEGYKRTVSEETAKLLSKFIDPQIQRVGVFVDDDPSRIKRLIYNGLIDIVQLHGNESDDYINELKSGEGSIIKVFKVDENFDLAKAESSAADMIMFDSGTGSGEKFDWSKIKDCKRPFILAGGLGPGNITEACKDLKGSGLYAVDMSSSVDKGGHKDEDLVIQAVNEAHGINF
ncbi:MAG: phosphoribosylanthranilate isomerase [Lachnospiraceae bacterium]|nr:phosphoribosylanthranilate isomerase [Lachnospiraceae bacterium]